jgi:hypothetical protein
MYLIAINNNGAFSVIDDEGDKVVYLFQEYDDVARFAMQLEECGFEKTEIIEYEDKQLLRTCELTNTKYAVIRPDDVVVPPLIDNDNPRKSTL